MTRSRLLLSVLALTLALLPGHPATAAEPYDLILRGGTIYDGSGGKPFVGDVAIRGDRIVAVGSLGEATRQGRGRRARPRGLPRLHQHAELGHRVADRTTAAARATSARA